MPLLRNELPSRLTLKRCLSCGYGGHDLQGEEGAFTFICRACGEDLYARPPKSYAELEGLDTAPVPQPQPLGLRGVPFRRLRRAGPLRGPRRVFAGLWRLVRRLAGAG